MKITHVECIPIQVKGTSPLRISKGATQTAYSVIIKLETDEGFAGFGEAVCGPPGYPEELQEEILTAVNRYLTPHLIGEDPSDIPALREKMERVLNGKYWTKAAVITALYDLMGKARKAPVCALLGGTWQQKVPNLSGMVGIDTPDTMARKALDLTAKGALTIKLKIGDTLDADADRIRAVREAVGPHVGIRVDANSHYQPEDAIRLIRKVERYNLLHVEAPVDKRDVVGMAKVHQSVHTPIMSDESVRVPIEAENLIAMNAVDIIKVKVTKMGFDGAAAILKTVRDAGKKCLLGHMLELGIAGTAEAHFALAHPELLSPHEIGSFRLIGIPDDIINESVDAYPNSFSLSNGYGLGVTMNEKRIESYRVDR